MLSPLEIRFMQAYRKDTAQFKQLMIIIPIKLLFFTMVGVYRPILRYTGLELLGTVFIGVFCSFGLMALAVATGMIAAPRSVVILDALLTIVLVITVRVLIRWFLYVAVIFPSRGEGAEFVVIYGAGKVGANIANAISTDSSYRLVGFIDDDPQLQKQIVAGFRVHSKRDLKDLVKKHKIDSVLLALPSISQKKSFQLVRELKSFGLNIKTIPGISDLISGRVAINRIRQIDISDILGREEVVPNQDLMRRNITNQTVVVTGAGGSIGSELCLQIMGLEPEQLILIERNELALYNIELELRNRYESEKVIPVLGSVANRQLVDAVFGKYNVDTVYHAAAYKHVPLLEANAISGIANNVKGTLTCVQAAIQSSVGIFVLISSDKAVRPSSIMGATKRISEQILQGYSNEQNHNTKFSIVRFGNVLDSAGSVVPLFRKQIAAGLDLTVTHREISRYFMSISEAVRLVIQSGALVKRGGEIFLLDMGDPIKIYDLAAQMIELSGFVLGKDINIDITGLRPGEKLHEELLIDPKAAQGTIHPKIFCSSERIKPWSQLSSNLDALFSSISNGNLYKTLDNVRSIVPEYQNPKNAERLN